MTRFDDTTFAIKQLAFERNYRYLFKQLNVELHSGELLQICGDNGSGKSTLLRILAGLIEPQEGQILWQNQCIFSEHPSYQTELHYLGHQNGIKQQLTVYENVLYYCTLTNNTVNHVTLVNLIAQMGLKALMHKKAINLSAGQLRRLAMLRFLSHPASLWIMDEPTTSLDTTGQQLLTKALQQHLANNGIAIIATHQALPFPDGKTLWLGSNHDK